MTFTIISDGKKQAKKHTKITRIGEAGWKRQKKQHWSVSSPQNGEEENKNVWIFLMCVIMEENPDKNGKKLI